MSIDQNKAAKTLDETKAKAAKAKGKAAKAKKAQKQEVALSVASGALQVDLGPRLVIMQIEADKTEEKANELYDQAEIGRGELMGRLTLGIINVAENDETVSLSDIFDKKAKDILAERLDIALGIRVLNADGSVSFADSVKKHFPQENASKATKATEAYKRRVQFRQNWTTKKKNAVMAAIAIDETGGLTRFDEDLKVLAVRNAPKAIAGPNHGESVETALTGKKNEGATQRASIAAFTELAKKAHGVASSGQKGKASETQTMAQKALEDESAFGELMAAAQTALNGKLDTVKAGSALTDQEKAAITNLHAACEAILTA